MNRLSRLLAEKRVVLADGAMGTSLFARGLETGGSPEVWNVERPDEVGAVHRGFVAAGSDLLLTNSFGANRRRLMLHGAEGRVAELNRAAARLAREAARESERTVLVAGDLGPTGEIFAPVGTFTPAEGEAVFAEQALALAEGGVDLLWIETISSAEELAAAVAELRAEEFLGANVTIPHKERVVPMVDRLTEEGQATGAVNTITREGKRLVGAGLPARG